MSSSPNSPGLDGIAIIGLEVRVPHAQGESQFWANLRDGVESLDRFPAEELIRHGADPQKVHDPKYVGVGRVLEDIDCFDASFFGYSPREAQLLDPQHRLFLESAWSALENAGYGARAQRPTTAVFAGEGLGSFMLSNLANGRDFPSPLESLVSHLGNDKDFLATRVSYHLDLTGPSAAIQTGCSSSLVAIAQAFHALSAYQCDMAVAGGISIRIPQKRGYLYTEDSILSPDGHCRPFDAKAAGTSFGSGLGIVVLKRLGDALRDRDPIRGVLRGVAINNDGAQKIGFTASNVQRQAEVVTMAQTFAGVDPQTIGYVEAHGTATALGDPIEAAALIQAFRLGGVMKHYCALGSVKGNVGHLDAASGAVGLIKTVLAMEHGAIPPTLFFEKVNPAIELEGSPFHINAELLPWESNGVPKRAGVSSLGIGGTNAHVVVEEAPTIEVDSDQESPPLARSLQLLPISAKTEEALQQQARNLAEHLAEHPQADLANVAYTLQVGREAFPLRRLLLASSLEEAQGKLETLKPTAEASGDAEVSPPPVVFLFPGQGAQYPGMGKELYRQEPVFRDQVDRCSAILEPHLGLDLRALLYGEDAETRAEVLRQTDLAQPAIFVVEYALARLWMEWGVYPKAMIGHSLGELVAAALSGAILLEDALELVATRGRLMSTLEKGAMMAVPLSEDEIAGRIAGNPDLTLAAVNTPELCTLSGTVEAIEACAKEWKAEGIPCRRLEVEHAFHSPMVEPMLDAYRTAVRKARPRPPGVPFLSNVTGTWITAEQTTDPEYWVDQIRQPVAFAAGIAKLLEEPSRALLEVGPGAALTTFAAAQVGDDPKRLLLSSLRAEKAADADPEILADSLGKLWIAGMEVDWESWHCPHQPRRIALPTYPFSRERHWPAMGHGKGGAAATRRLGIDHWMYLPSWRRSTAALSGPGELPTGPWMVFADAEGYWDPLVEQLIASGRSVVVVRPGDRFAEVGPRTFTLDPASAEQYRQLRHALAKQERPAHILHLWLAQSEDLPPCHALERGFDSLHHLAETFLAEPNADGLDLSVITSRAQEVAGEEIVPQLATVFGACRVLPQEYPELQIRCVDVAGVEGSRASEDSCNTIKALLSDPPSGLFHAVRGGYRWTASQEELPTSTPPEGTGLREKGVYLITGGTHGIGLVLAQYLARSVAARLILLSRSGALASEERAELEALGAEVEVLKADVTDRERMIQCIAEATARFGNLHGIIHAAGVPGAGPDADRNGERPGDAGPDHNALQAKLFGTFVLEQHATPELDFVVYCSALATRLGGLGQADYCAGNAFLDAMATSQNSKPGPRYLSIGWDTWSEVGMAVDAEVPESLAARKKSILQMGLSNEEGVEIFRRAMAHSAPHVLVSKLPLAERLAGEIVESDFLDEPRSYEDTGVDSFPSSAAAPALETSIPKTIAENVCAIWNQLLGVTFTRPEQSFFEQGGNSLLATQMLARLRAKYPEAEFSLRSFFDEPTLQALIDAIPDEGPVVEAAPSAASLKQEPPTSTPVPVEILEPTDLEGLRRFLCTEVASAVGVEAETITAQTNFSDFNEVLIAAHLTDALRVAFGTPFYPHEVRAVGSVAELAEHVAAELERQASADSKGAGGRQGEGTAVATQEVATKSKPVSAPAPPPQRSTPTQSVDKSTSTDIAFLLSAPRSGSTLLRLMLSAHPGLLCPPELFLLDHDTMGAWSNDPFAEFYRDGIVRGLMEQRGLDFSDAKTMVDVLVERDAPVEEAYALLRGSGERLLLDKTPTYGGEEASLERAERLFGNPKYLVLVRHPYSVIESIVRNRLDRVRQAEGDSHEIAEQQWRKTYRNLVRLQQGHAGARTELVRYEDLMAAPQETLERICTFLGVPFDPAVLDPYGNGKMIGGPGDPHLFERGQLDPSLGEAWKSIRLPRALSDETLRLADHFGYACPS